MSGNLFFVDVKRSDAKRWENVRVCENFNEAIYYAFEEHKIHAGLKSKMLKIRVVDRDNDSTVLMLDRTLYLDNVK